ncbi:MAG: TIGR00266 family protein [Nitrosopumilus sp.]|nr:TIGR00266 family protein [Nitrosopumilus sp.]MDH5659017.1 TIGR00266 family protein [Nitrosopumilus sp.]
MHPCGVSQFLKGMDLEKLLIPSSLKSHLLQYEILKNPLGIIHVSMNKGDKITAEAGSLVFIKGDIETITSMRKGGFLKTLKTAALGGESFFVNNFIAQEDNCTLGLTGNMLGDIEVINVKEEFIVQSGAYVGSTNDLTLDTQWQGFTKGIFGSNLFMLKTLGDGDMFVNAWGGILSMILKDGEKMILDNYQLVAMSASADYRVTKHGGLKTSILGGEALVIEITGPGTIYYQTKNFTEFVRALIPFLPRRNN